MIKDSNPVPSHDGVRRVVCRCSMICVVLMAVIFVMFDPVLRGTSTSWHQCIGLFGKVLLIAFGTLAVVRGGRRGKTRRKEL